MITDGDQFSAVLERFDDDDRRALVRSNAEQVIGEVIKAYDGAHGQGDVGRDGSGIAKDGDSTSLGPVGLIYGRIQSGKTTAMFTSVALAFDNHFRIAVVLTSDINRLVDQTSDDFVSGIPGLNIVNKDDLKETFIQSQIDTVGQALLEDPNYSVVIVCSKGAAALSQVLKFLRGIDGGRYPSLILDDEGDQATLDTSTRARSKGDDDIEPSAIFSLVHGSEVGSLREVLTHNVFVSVTGTPQSIVLQSLNSESRPSFVCLISAGEDYTGGDTFFGEDDPLANRYISLLEETEGASLQHGDVAPIGLQRAILRFIVNASAAGTNLGWRQYKMLVHPSVKTSDHQKVLSMMSAFLRDVFSALVHPDKDSSKLILSMLRVEYDEMKSIHALVSFDEVLGAAKKRMSSRRLNLVNKDTTGQTIKYVDGFNFLVGGNSVGRGLAFRDLLVTYYLRNPRSTNLDTMYQHARMFGYRQEILPFITVFVTEERYGVFARISKSDADLRRFIEDHGGEIKTTLVGVGGGIRPTRLSVLDAKKIDTVFPGSQLYPNRPIYRPRESVAIRDNVLGLLDSIFPDYRIAGDNGVEVASHDAGRILRAIRTRATNGWKDGSVADLLEAVASGADRKVMLHFRTGETGRIAIGGTLPTGVLSGEVVERAHSTRPTLWIVQVTARNVEWSPADFVFPTIVWPKSRGPWVFAEGQ